MNLSASVCNKKEDRHYCESSTNFIQQRISRALGVLLATACTVKTSVFPKHTMVCSPNTPFVLKITHDKVCFWGV